jgi:hypothetical protein
MVFSRTTGDNLTSLVKKIDAASQKGKIKSFVVFLGDEEKLESELKKIAEKNGIQKTVFAIDNPAGPAGYKVSKDAEVTVVLYNKRDVKANHAFRKGELNAQAIERIVADLGKLTKSDAK